MHAVTTRELPLRGRTALVTGVSRRRGIGFAIANSLAALGASVVIHHFQPHDLEQPWGADDMDAVCRDIENTLAPGARFGQVGVDFTRTDAVREVLDATYEVTGDLDIVVCNHAKSGGDGGILDMTADALDAHWRTNARSTIELTAEFARRKAGRDDFDGSTPVGRVLWLTSGQIHGPMRGEVAYATSKAALAGITPTVAAELMPLGIVLNTIDPGPVNTGYLDAETADRPLDEIEATRTATPFGRYGTPADVAELASWLVSDRGSWMVGQVLTSDGGFGLV